MKKEKSTVAMMCRFVLSGMLSSLGQNPTAIRARPVTNPGGATDQLTTLTPDPPHHHLVAVGTSDGCIQLVDISTGIVIKDFNVHTCAIR